MCKIFINNFASFLCNDLLQHPVFTTLLLINCLIISPTVNAQEAKPPLVIQSASEPDYPPLSLASPDGKADGFSVHLLRASIQAMGREVNFKVAPWSKIKQQLAEGQIQVLPLVGRTPERETLYDFTTPYLSLHGTIVVRKGDEQIKTLQDLKDLEIIVMKGDNAEEFILREQISEKIISTTNYQAALELLAAGQHDAVVVQRLVGLQLIRQLKLDNLTTVGKPLPGFRQDFCFAVHDGDKALLALLNEGLAVVMANGTYQDLHDRWLNILAEEPDPWVLLKPVLLAIVSSVLLVGLLAWLWQRSLATQVRIQTSTLKRQAKIIDQIQDSIISTDLDHRITFWNLGAQRLFAYSAEQAIGQTIGIIFPENSFPTAIKKGEYHIDTRMSKQSGEIFDAALGLSLFYDESDNPVGLIYYAMDISDRKKAQDALQELNETLELRVKERTEELQHTKEKAEAANRAKSIFLANMSHELRTPMNAVLGFSSLMMNDTDITTEQKSNLDIINRSGTHLLDMINDILDIAKIEAGRIVIEIQPFNLNSMLTEIVALVQEQAYKKGLSLLYEEPDQVPHFIESDQAKIRQILINLLGNAIKYTQQGGVTLRVKTDANQATKQDCVLIFEIEDSGIGISSENISRIFKPFIQVTDKVEQKGTGLGLPITKQFIELLAGNISVTSTENKGSLFRVTLPVIKVAESQVQKAPTEPRKIIGIKPNQKKYRLLIVEDQLENRLLLHNLLQPLGFELKEAFDGQQAITLFEQWHPDLIWMDIRMPVMDGIEATKMIRTMPGGQETIIIALTASAFQDQRNKILAAGSDDFISKPYRNNEIYQCINKHLGVEFIYQSQSNSVTLSDSDNKQQLLSGFNLLNRQLITALHQAALKLDIEESLTVVEQIEREDADLAKDLRLRIDQMDFQGILDLLQ